MRTRQPRDETQMKDGRVPLGRLLWGSARYVHSCGNTVLISHELASEMARGAGPRVAPSVAHLMKEAIREA